MNTRNLSQGEYKEYKKALSRAAEKHPSLQLYLVLMNGCCAGVFEA